MPHGMHSSCDDRDHAIGTGINSVQLYGNLHDEMLHAEIGNLHQHEDTSGSQQPEQSFDMHYGQLEICRRAFRQAREGNDEGERSLLCILKDDEDDSSLGTVRPFISSSYDNSSSSGRASKGEGTTVSNRISNSTAKQNESNSVLLHVDAEDLRPITGAKVCDIFISTSIYTTRDKFSEWRCHTVAREQHGTKRRFEQFEHLSFFAFIVFPLYLYPLSFILIFLLFFLSLFTCFTLFPMFTY